MAVATYEPLGTITLSSGANAATFSNIPSRFRDLVVVINAGRTSGGDQPYLRLNGDTGANYTWIAMWGRDSATGAAAQGSFTSFISLGYNAFLWNAFNYNSITQIMDYSATDKHKTVLVRANNASGPNATEATTGRWANTAAVTSVTITNLGTVQAGSTIALYGIAG